MSSRSPASASSLDVASASPLPTLPDELVDRVAGMCARRGGLREWCRSWRGTCRRLADVAWFEKNARGGAPIAIVPSAACPTVQMGLSRAVEAPPRADVRSDSDAPLTSSRAIDPDPDPDAIVREPIVLVKPGTYPENVRVTSSCALLGWGDPADVVIEARGWEPALAFAGLGAAGSRSLVAGLSREKTERLGVAHLATAADLVVDQLADGGEDALVANLTVCVRNAMQNYAAIIVSGKPKLTRVFTRGGIMALGARTAPRMTACVVRRARGAGVRVTDHAKVAMEGSRVEACGGAGVVVERGGEMRMDRCVVAGNGAEAVVTTPGARARGGESLLFGEGLDGDDLRATNDLGPVVVVHLDHPGAEEEEEEAEAEAEAEGASPGDGRVEARVLENVRRTREGAETDAFLHGEAPDERWFRPEWGIVGEAGGEEEEDGIEIGYDA